MLYAITIIYSFEIVLHFFCLTRLLVKFQYDLLSQKKNVYILIFVFYYNIHCNNWVLC